MSATPLRWRLTRRLLRRLIASAARRILANRTRHDQEGNELCWLKSEIDEFLRAVEFEATTLRPHAKLESLPSFGNRLMVELAVYTAACDRALRRKQIAPESARQVLADLGWDVYSRMLRFTSWPIRLITRDPGRRLRWTIGMLLRFPFNAPGEPGYAVKTWVRNGDLYTHFTHCPPQSFVRRASEAERDPDMLEAFQQSWCRYDWPGADLIADDGQRGHYWRGQTLSHGDPVCDMCWSAQAGLEQATEAELRFQPKAASDNDKERK